MTSRERPAWWDWDLELSPHLLKRMVDRQFTEVDLRSMLVGVRSVRPDIIRGRWVAVTRYRRKRWEIIVEPDRVAELIVVITAYAVD